MVWRSYTSFYLYPPDGTVTHPGHGLFACIYVRNVDDTVIRQAYGEYGKIERVGDPENALQPSRSERISWAGQKHPREEFRYQDIPPRCNEVLYFAYPDNDEVVFFSMDKEIRRFKKGVFNVDILVGGEFENEPIKKRIFRGRLTYDGGDKLKFEKR